MRITMMRSAWPELVQAFEGVEQAKAQGDCCVFVNVCVFWGRKASCAIFTSITQCHIVLQHTLNQLCASLLVQRSCGSKAGQESSRGRP